MSPSASRFLAVCALLVLLLAPSSLGGDVTPLDPVSPYGSGSGGGGGNLPGVASAITDGHPGSLCTWTLDGSPPGVVCLYLLGFHELSLDLVSVGLPGATLLASYELLLVPMATDLTGSASMTLKIPGNPALVGMSVYNQWIVADPTNSFLDSTTNGVKVTIIP